MKTTLCFILTLLTFVMLTLMSNSFAQDASNDYIVRVIYFLPNDRQPQPDMDAKLNTLMKEAQQFYADVMESYGFDRKTFHLETDENGKVRVHHVNGESNDTYYHDGTLEKVVNELRPKFDTSKNIYFVAIDISSERFDVNQPNSHVCGQAIGTWAASPASGICFDYNVIAHELGHSFGLDHDKFNYADIDSMVNSFCTAEWLDAHSYFNEGSQTNFNEPTTINMFDPSRGLSPNAVRFSFEVRDADGLHQARLYVPTLDSVVACKRLNSENTTVEFDITYVVSGLNSIWLKVIDVKGNHTAQHFQVDISEFLLPPKRITIPDSNLATAIRVHTELPPKADITTDRMVRLTKLFPISDDPIADITGLEHATNLVALSLYRQNEITDFSALRGLRELRFLELTGTGISDISVLSASTKLQTLYLYDNAIEDVSALTGLTNLKTLELWANNISNITSLAGLINLTYLDLHNNQISDVSPIAGLINLTYLDLNGNQISDVSPITELTNLEKLYLVGNPIKDQKSLLVLLKKNPNVKIFYKSLSEPLPVTWNPPPSPLVSESERPPMYWVDTDAGTLHRLVGAKVENLLPSVQNATSLALDTIHGKIYWTEKTNGRTGTLRRANFSGNANVELVKNLTSVPLSIALDTTNRKIYLANSWGKIQCLNFDGSNFQPNLITDLESPKQIAVDGVDGKVYWTEQTGDTTGKIRRANLDGSNVQLVKETSVPLSLALDTTNRKIYVTNAWGKIQRMNFDGSNFQPNLITGLASPAGIAVDAVNGKLYWTDQGGISRANLNGKNIENIVTGLDAPANIALGVIPDDEPTEQKVVSLPDKNLAKAVRKALGLGNNAPITRQHMLKLSVLDAKNSKIKNLTGLEHAKQLTRLNLDRNQIRNLNPLSGLTHLEELTLDENQISNVHPLTDLTQLKWLLIGGNPIKNAGVRLLADLKQLRGLSLYRTEMSNVKPIANLTKLESLWLDYNQIRDVSPLGTLTNLRTLHLRENRIRDVSSLTKLTELTSLRLAENPIKDVGPLASLRNLEDVDIEIPAAAPTLVMSVPEKTDLHPNYPNPFNPETWIPYQLATPADVRIAIYAADGKLVRTLNLGYQSVGNYDSRSRAAYWDGRNALGEPVASGLYFYTLTAGDFTATRRLLIRK